MSPRQCHVCGAFLEGARRTPHQPGCMEEARQKAALARRIAAEGFLAVCKDVGYRLARDTLDGAALVVATQDEAETMVEQFAQHGGGGR